MSFDINALLKQAQEMQNRINQIQDEMAIREIEGQSGGGMVKITITGKGEVKRVNLDSKIVDPNDKEVLEDLIVAAFNDAKSKADEEFNSSVNNITGGMQLPPGFKLPI